MAYKRWIIADADKEKASVISEKLNIDPFIAFLLVSRGMDNELTASEFLSDGCRFSSPFSLVDMDKAVSRINRAIENGEHICIFGDYDCDGVTSTALLYTFFESLGADVSYYIPNRVTDGYGMNMAAIDEIKARGTSLIVTVDNGISSIDEAEYIYSLGMELVVTDHHQVGDTLPRAEAVVNPHREDNHIEFRDYAGVGVAFKLACAIYDGEVEELIEQLADLVAIGTIGDVMPLKNENRSIVKAGLELINSDSRIGISALKAQAGSSDELKAGDVAFQLCPRINAAGRMDNASRAVELLICDDYEQAEYLAAQLNIENNHRHEVENNIKEDIDLIVGENPSLIDDSVIVIAGRNYHKGVVGIVAASLVERYGKPSIVISIDDDGAAMGSARSIEGFNIYAAIQSCEDILDHFGGHPLAAGIGLDGARVDEFRRRLNEYAGNNYSVMPVPSIKLDCKLSPFYLNTELVDSLCQLEPYGADNPQPVFCLSNMTLKSVSPIGEGKHIRLEVMKKGKIFRVVKFRTSPDEFPYKAGDSIDLAVKAAKNFYKGKFYLSIQAVDIRKNGIDENKYLVERTDYEMLAYGKKPSSAVYPDRLACAVIYKYLKANNGWRYSVEDLYFNLQSDITLSQLMFALDAFEEAGLITCAGVISVNNVSGKADLDNTTTLRNLKGRI